MKLTKLIFAIVGGFALTLLAVGLTFAAPDAASTVTQHSLFEPTITPTVTITPTTTITPTPTVTPTVTPVPTSTLTRTHPVAQAIALHFHLPYTEVMSLHDAGLGFGQIARAYLTALASGGVLSPTQVLEMIQSGMGWGQIKQQYGIHPGGLGLGSIMSGRAAPVPVTDTLSSGGGYGQPAKSYKIPAPSSPGNSNQSGSSTCPGNSCNAPGHNKPGKGPKK